MTDDAVLNQVCAEFAFANAMGWDDWTPDEEAVEGMVRGFYVQWQPDWMRGLVVPADADDDAGYVLVTGLAPTFEIRGWITAGQAKEAGYRIGEG
jgi:hypothetical protein